MRIAETFDLRRAAWPALSPPAVRSGGRARAPRPDPAAHPSRPDRRRMTPPAAPAASPRPPARSLGLLRRALGLLVQGVALGLVGVAVITFVYPPVSAYLAPRSHVYSAAETAVLVELSERVCAL